jgi:hypothetical protein
VLFFRVFFCILRVVLKILYYCWEISKSIVGHMIDM